MEASCVPPERTIEGIPKLKRLWRARNTLGSKLSERRAKLRREGIITDEADSDESASDSEDDAENSDLSVSRKP
jgi:hypothetical protein